MEDKSNNQNEMSKENGKNKFITPELIADVAGCSPVTVRKVLNGERNAETALGQNIHISKMLLEEGFNHLLAEVKKVVAF